MKNIVVLYHKNCSDGFGAAWAAWKKFGNKTDYIPVAHQEPPPDDTTGKRLYLLDFCYDVNITKQLLAAHKQVTVIDHHTGRAPIIQLTHDYRYDPTHSGAVLAWQYFHPGAKIPRLLQYIEDKDLWRFALAETKEISAFLQLIPFNFNAWNTIARAIESTRGRKKYIAQGKIICQYANALIDSIITNDAELVEFEGHKTLAVNSQFSHSELGHALAKKMPPISITWTQKGATRSFSLRSTDPIINVARIAEKFGGGGHPAAAGFSLPSTDPLPWKSIP